MAIIRKGKASQIKQLKRTISEKQKLVKSLKIELIGLEKRLTALSIAENEASK